MNRQAWVGLLKDWGIAFGITLAILVAWQMLSPSPPSGGDAPPLHAPHVTGRPFALEDEQADAYVINFWATWCAPCRREIPEFSRFARLHPEIAMYGVSVDEMGSAQLAAKADQLGITYNVLHDAQGRAASHWGVQSFPTTFVLDRYKRIVHVQVGMMDAKTLAAAVAKAR